MIRKWARPLGCSAPEHASRRVRHAARMRGALAVSFSSNPSPPPRVIYQPPHLLARYHRAKMIGSALFAVIFAGWLWLQWSNPWMRIGILALMVLTGWFTAWSILADLRRHRGRQVELAGEGLLITSPEGTCWIQLDEVSHAHWSDEGGLTFLRADGQPLGTMDLMFLADEEEARRFLGWLRQRKNIPWKVRWPSRA